MNPKFPLFFLIGTILFPVFALAVDTTGQVIAHTVLSYGDNFLVTLSTAKSSRISCDTNSSIGHAVYTIPLTTPWGKTAAASIITAKVTGSTVKIYGANVCNYWGNTEDAAMVASE